MFGLSGQRWYHLSPFNGLSSDLLTPCIRIYVDILVNVHWNFQNMDNPTGFAKSTELFFTRALLARHHNKYSTRHNFDDASHAKCIAKRVKLCSNLWQCVGIALNSLVRNQNNVQRDLNSWMWFFLGQSAFLQTKRHSKRTYPVTDFCHRRRSARPNKLHLYISGSVRFCRCVVVALFGLQYEPFCASHSETMTFSALYVVFGVC